LPEENNPETREVIAPNGDCVADVWPGHGEMPVEANARLIAAAPELLEAAKDTLEFMQTLNATDAPDMVVAQDVFEYLTNAIERAEDGT